MERLDQLVKEKALAKPQLDEVGAMKKRIGDLEKDLKDRQQEQKSALNAWNRYWAMLGNLKQELRNAELLSLKPMPMTLKELNAHSKALKTFMHILKSLEFEPARKLATKFGPDSAIQAVDDLHAWSHELLESLGACANKCDQLASQWAEFETMRRNVDDFLTRKQTEWRKLVEKSSKASTGQKHLAEFEVSLVTFQIKPFFKFEDKSQVF